MSLLSNFFHTAKKASSAGFFVMLGLLIISMVLNGVYEEADWKGQPAPFYVMLIPPVAIFRALYLLNKQAMTWETLTVDHEVSNTFGWLLLSSVIFVGVGQLSEQRNATTVWDEAKVGLSIPNACHFCEGESTSWYPNARHNKNK